MFVRESQPRPIGPNNNIPLGIWSFGQVILIVEPLPIIQVITDAKSMANLIIIYELQRTN